jgi:hypothetical protein
VLIGGNGFDKITAGGGNDLVIGGAGGDKVAGAAGDDLLISSATRYDAPTSANAVALGDLLAAWNNGSDYASRVAAIQSGGGVGSAGSMINRSTVEGDTDADSLNGAAGLDVYFAEANDKAKPARNLETLVLPA